jgi:putative nucleotidyltransferase with HDIG domain
MCFRRRPQIVEVKLLKNLPFKLKFYITIIDIIGLLILFKSIDVFKIPNLGDFLFFLILAVLAESFKVDLPYGGGVTVGFAVVFASILLFGASAGAWIAAVGILLKDLHNFSSTPLYKRLFNAGMFAIMAGASGSVYKLLGGMPGHIELGQNLLPIAASILVYAFINITLLTVVMSIASGNRPVSIWVSNLKWATPHYLALGPLGILLGLSYTNFGYQGVVLLLIPILAARHSFKLYMEMRKVYLETIQALASAIEAKDPYTKGHSERVAQYAVKISREMGLPEDRVEIIQYAALLHDIGKIGISDRILNKPGSLSDIEFETIKSHPAIGSQIIRGVRFLEKASELVKHHHEKRNGTGYPDGLKQDQIPLGAEILSVADIFDALTSDRPYRKAWSIKEAVNQLKKEAKAQLNPNVVNALIRVLEKEGVV